MKGRIVYPEYVFGPGRSKIDVRFTTDANGEPTLHPDSTDGAATITRVSKGRYRLNLGKSRDKIDWTLARGMVDARAIVKRASGREVQFVLFEENATAELNLVGAGGASPGTILGGTATVAYPTFYAVGDLLAGGLAHIAVYPKILVVGNAGTTPAESPPTVVIVGTDVNDNVQTETLSLDLIGGGNVYSGKKYKTISKVEFAAGTGTGGLVSIGYGGVTAQQRDVIPHVDFLCVGPAMHWQEWTDPPLQSTNGLKAPVALPESILVWTADDLLVAGKEYLASEPRNLYFFTGGGDSNDAPATAQVSGYDASGNYQWEEVVPYTDPVDGDPGGVYTVKAYSSVEKVVFQPALGPDSTMQLGWGKAFGLYKPIRVRADVPAAVACVESNDGAVTVANGVFTIQDDGSGMWAPSQPPNGSLDFALFYEASDAREDLISGEAILSCTFKTSDADR